MEEEVRRQPPRQRGVNMALLVTDNERPSRRLAVFVEHMQLDDHGREAIKQERLGIRPGSGPLLLLIGLLTGPVKPEADLRLAPSGIAAIYLQDSVFDSQAGKVGEQRLSAEHLQVQEAVRYGVGAAHRRRWTAG